MLEAPLAQGRKAVALRLGVWGTGERSQEVGRSGWWGAFQGQVLGGVPPLWGRPHQLSLPRLSHMAAGGPVVGKRRGGGQCGAESLPNPRTRQLPSPPNRTPHPRVAADCPTPGIRGPQWQAVGVGRGGRRGVSPQRGCGPRSVWSVSRPAGPASRALIRLQPGGLNVRHAGGPSRLSGLPADQRPSRLHFLRSPKPDAPRAASAELVSLG